MLTSEWASRGASWLASGVACQKKRIKNSIEQLDRRKDVVKSRMRARDTNQSRPRLISILVMSPQGPLRGFIA